MIRFAFSSCCPNTAANQIESPQPSRHIVRTIWTRIEAVLINVGAAVLTRYIPPF